MALVPVQCPSCGASVDLEEGQTVARCAYCGDSSVLVASRRAPKPKPTAPGPKAPPKVSPPKRMSRGALIAIAIAALAVVGLFAGIAFLSGADLDYMQDAEPAERLLTGHFGDGARYVSIHMQASYLYVEVLKADGTTVTQRFDGRSPRGPEPGGKADEVERAGAFDLDEVDFGVVPKIARHAEAQAPKGNVEFLLLQRRLPYQADLLWEASVEVAGERRHTIYDLSGDPLVDEPLDFFAPEDDWFARFEDKAGKNARLVGINLLPTQARIEAMAGKSKRDTDAYTLGTDGVISAPEPSTNDGDAAELAAQVFALRDVEWSVVPKVVADAKKELDAEIQQVTIRRVDGELELTVFGNTKRGASRTAYYDRKGKRRRGPGE